MKKNLKNTALIALSLMLISITFCRSNTAMAESETVLYDMVWKIVNSRFIDQTNNGQDWERWRHKYDDKIKTLVEELKLENVDIFNYTIDELDNKFDEFFNHCLNEVHPYRRFEWDCIDSELNK